MMTLLKCSCSYFFTWRETVTSQGRHGRIISLLYANFRFDSSTGTVSHLTPVPRSAVRKKGLKGDGWENWISCGCAVSHALPPSYRSELRTKFFQTLSKPTRGRIKNLVFMLVERFFVGVSFSLVLHLVPWTLAALKTLHNSFSLVVWCNC